jgi:alkaline phosphatase
MASGVKSTKYAIGKDAERNDLHLITKRAIELGKAAGVVSSVQFSHATPAGFVAHNESRKAYAEIALEMLLDSKLNVIMGCGAPDFDVNGDTITDEGTKVYKYVGGKGTWDSLVAGATMFDSTTIHGNNQVQDIDGDATPDAWSMVRDSMDFVNLASGNTPKRVLGVPKVAYTLNHDRLPYLTDTIPYALPLNKNVPMLKDMTGAALNVLDNDTEGFFLMVEGGAVDWAGHGNSMSRLIEEQKDFDDAVGQVINWVEANSNWDETLVIVTGDHETGYLVGPNHPEDQNVWEGADADTMKNTYALVDSSAGNLPGYKWLSGDHTNQLIPLYAKGPGSEMLTDYADQEDLVRGRYIDNTDMGHLLFDLWPEPSYTLPQPKNIMLFISDGWSKNHLDAANFFMGEYQDYQEWDEWYMSTYSAGLDKTWELTDSSFHSWYNSTLAWTMENWVKRDGGYGATGSAPAATSMYSGVKSTKYAIGVDAYGKPVKTFCERAYETGKSVGVVSSVQFSHATPAAMFAHNTSRKNYAQIANEMLLDSKANVIMGCGAPDYDSDGQQIATPDKFKYVGGKGTWNNILNGDVVYDSTSIKGNNTVQDIDADGNPDAWTLVRDSADFVAMGKGKTPLRVLGIPMVASTLNNDRSGSGDAFDVPLNKNVPKLADMTKAAINVLDNNNNGFAVMIEGGAVDWAGHANNLARIIEEQEDFNNAVDSAVKWVEDSSSWDETLIIVTGDHETGYLVGPNWDPNDMWGTYPLTDNGQGNMPGGQFLSGDHTNMLIPFYVNGKGSEVFAAYADHFDFFRSKYLDNTEIGQGVFKMYKSLPDADPDFKAASIITNTTAPKAQKTNNINVYPSPTDGIINIVVDEAPAIISIFDITGNEVASGQINENISSLNIAGNQPGIYIIEVQTANATATKKVMLK